jgi:hypothetical protein
MPDMFADIYGTPQTFTVFDWTSQGAGTVTQIVRGTHLMNGLTLLVDVTGKTGTLTLDVYIQKELPNGGYTDIAHLTQMSAVGARYCDIIHRGAVGAEAAVQDAALGAGTVNTRIFGQSIRVKAVIGGTTPTVTGKVYLTLYRYDK